MEPLGFLQLAFVSTLSIVPDVGLRRLEPPSCDGGCRLEAAAYSPFDARSVYTAGGFDGDRP